MNDILKIFGKSIVAPDLAMSTIQTLNIGHLVSKNKDKILEVHEDNFVTMNATVQNKNGEMKDVSVSLLGTLSDDVPYLKGVNDNNYYIVDGKGKYKNGKPRKKVNLKKLIRYTLSQLLPGRVRDGNTESLSDLGFKLGRELTTEEIETLKGSDEGKKKEVVENLLQNGFDNHYDGDNAEPLVPAFPLTDDRVLNLESVSRANVTIDSETYISNVMVDGSGRGANLPLASNALAQQRAKKIYEEKYGGSFDELEQEEKDKYIEDELSNVEKWMESNGYTWHEIDDKANLQKVPTHLHECLRHKGGVSLSQNKYAGDCYNSGLQQRVANNSLEGAKMKLADKQSAYDKALASNNQKSIRDTKRALDAQQERVALLEKHASGESTNKNNSRNKFSKSKNSKTNG